MPLMDFRYLITFPESPGQFRVMTLRFEPKRDANGRPVHSFKAFCRRKRSAFEEVLWEQAASGRMVVVWQFRPGEDDPV